MNITKVADFRESTFNMRELLLNMCVCLRLSSSLSLSLFVLFIYSCIVVFYCFHKGIHRSAEIAERLIQIIK